MHLVRLMRPSPVLQTELMTLPRVVKLLPTYSCDLNTALTLTCGIILSTWQRWIFRRQSSKCKLSAGRKKVEENAEDVLCVPLIPQEYICYDPGGYGECNFCP